MSQELIEKLFKITDELTVRVNGLKAVEMLIEHRVSQIEHNHSEASEQRHEAETKIMESIKKISDKQDSLISRLDFQDGAKQAFKYLPTLFQFAIAMGTLILMIRSFK